MWVGAVDRRFLDLALEASTALYLGEFRKELYLGFRRNFQFGRQLMNPKLSARLATESVRRFNADRDELGPLEIREGLGFVGIERAFDPDWQVALGGVGHAWHEPGRDRSTLGATARVEKTSRSRGRVLRADLVWTALYSRAGFDGEALVKI